ncbi:uncharacterized protein LOC112574565 [Pomacea canaliculata]|uniref:uncharacterized protein LOC112574565 n=1 Tax=Pomacea canaliculata TaxID=400727 RepID=UPI000D72F340|nr:uncharacterized protein LOC112574565 [Pomacea canaliculata]
MLRQQARKVFNRHSTKRNTSLIATDAMLLILELLQVLALLQAMSLKWFWPKSWMKNTNFIFLFNMDIWEFIKVECGAFIGMQNHDIPSSSVTMQFASIIFGWFGFFVLFGLILLIVKLVLWARHPPYLMIHNARLERAFIIIVQIISLPFGASAFKVFQCASGGELSIDNNITCWEGLHWAYLVPVIMAIIGLYIVFPAFLVWRIRQAVMAASENHHEDYLKLKEVEYMSGLDVVWEVEGFHIFSSFRLNAVYYRPVIHTLKLILLVIYAMAYQHITVQAVLVAVVLFIMAVTGGVLRPFRVMLFNIVFVLGFFCLAGDAIFGSVITQYSSVEVSSPWLVDPYSRWILTVINGILSLSLAAFLLYLISYHLCCHGCSAYPLWPVMTAYEYKVEGVETMKYLATVLQGRAIIEHCRRLPAMFSPVHELSHQIQILNAYMRESELMHDGLHPTLWAVLDEMIDLYQRLEPQSLFGGLWFKNLIRKNAANFMTLMPMFARRLAQRDYDFILVPPVKKRLLLKMYIIAMLREGSRQHKRYQQLTKPSLTRIWEESADKVNITEAKEYHEELYPPPLQGPDMEALYMTGSLDTERRLYDLDVMEEEEESLAAFLQRSPPVLALKDDSRRGSESTSEGQHESSATMAGIDNSSFVRSFSNTSRPTVVAADVSKAHTDVSLADLEASQGADGYTVDHGKTNMVLTNFNPGESSTD